ncbi:Ndj1p KNAG_0K00620 [Huiozyma naganishii CBS 8797]|uniref:Uncharacterized protein n=1 Tax=Huiozyma naganishii (strain ATCC MYA-139 / BCRC 22969 / CBS 8797 / KCTC 17520 / NBRC 10181 / NCYC 3082 / Yp74L-3) TaxID=1071383 RepID=J7RC07_HUIN7|nr:hypothetical protein KNAG_0K00620 [Kazachstania naganishii CBS 8797]CCK72430.1 hypothetical protein KNAG_0K00620 [Kazachstania naganishii CBS 8797]
MGPAIMGSAPLERLVLVPIRKNIGKNEEQAVWPSLNSTPSLEVEDVRYFMDMNKVLSDQCGSTHSRPFRVFEDHYAALSGSNKYRYNIQEYFRCGVPVSGDDTTTDITLTDHDDHQCVFPQLFTAQLGPSGGGHLRVAADNFRGALHRYIITATRLHPGKNRLLRECTESLQKYAAQAISTTADVWTQWVACIQRKMPETTPQLYFRDSRILANLAKERFNTTYFIFKNSAHCSLRRFCTLLEAPSRFGNDALVPELRQGKILTFGIWVDTANDIMIFANGKPKREAEAEGGAAEVTATSGVCLTADSPTSVAKRVLLFVNLCLLQCITQEFH